MTLGGPPNRLPRTRSEGADVTTGRAPSLRTRITRWYAILLGVPLAGFALVCYVVFGRALIVRTDRFVGEALTVFSREVVAERRTASTTEEAIATTGAEVRFRNLRVVVRDSAGRVVADGRRYSGAAAADTDRVLEYLRVAGMRPETVTVAGPTGGDRVITQPLSVHGERFAISGASSLADVQAVMERLTVVFMGSIPVLLVVASVSAWLLARRGLAPIGAMAARANEISASNLDARLPVAGDLELAELARVINSLLDRLEAAFVQQRRFMADASHELRTPTTIVRTEADVTLSRPHREESEYRESVGVILEAARRLARIVDDLFLMARADAGQLALRDEPLYLEEIVHDATRSMAQVGERRGVRVELRHMTQAPLRGDADLLGRVFLNLLDNAIKHSPEGGAVIVGMGSDGGSHVVSVVDEGPGIPPDLHESVFERFFRVDPSRARGDQDDATGAGLGLSIARRIVMAHGGRIVVAESRPGRTEFRVTLPRTET